MKTFERNSAFYLSAIEGFRLSFFLQIFLITHFVKNNETVETNKIILLYSEFYVGLWRAHVLYQSVFNVYFCAANSASLKMNV